MNDTTFMLLTIYRIQLTLNYAKRSLPQCKAVHVNDINWSFFNPIIISCLKHIAKTNLLFISVKA